MKSMRINPIFILVVATALSFFNGHSALSEGEKQKAEEAGHAHEKSEKKAKPEAHSAKEAHKEEGEEGHDHGEESEEGEEHGHGHEEGHKEGGEEHGHGGGHGHEEEEGGARVGPDKGIRAFDEHQGFQLSPEAMKRFQISAGITVGDAQKNFQTPISSLVQYQQHTGVYRLRGGWFKLVTVKVNSKSASQLSFESSGFKKGDQIVTGGTALLRVVEMEAKGGSGDGHGH